MIRATITGNGTVGPFPIPQGAREVALIGDFGGATIEMQFRQSGSDTDFSAVTNSTITAPDILIGVPSELFEVRFVTTDAGAGTDVYVTVA
jgi:hypothetical protein